MNTTEMRAQITEMLERVQRAAEELPVEQQYRTEYAMQHIGRVLADVHRIEAWHKAVMAWQEGEGLMSSFPPSLRKYVKEDK